MLQSEPPPPPTDPQPSRRRRHRRRPRSGDVADHDHRDLHDDHQRGANDQLDPIALLERVKHLPTKDLATVPPTRAQGVWTTLAVWIPLPGPIRSWFSLTPVGAAVAPASLPAADDDSIRRKKSSTGKRKSKAKPRRDAESEFALRLQSQVAEFERLQAEQEASVKANILLPATAPAADPATSLGGPCDSSASPDPSTRLGDAPTTTTVVSDDEDDPYNLRDLLKATNSAPAESTQPTSPARSSTPPPAVIAARPSLAAALDLGPTPGLILLRSNLHLPPSPTRRTLDPPLLPHAEEPRGRTRARAPRRASAASDSFQQQPDKSHRDPSVHSSVSQVASSSAAHQSLTPEAVAEIAAMRTQLAELKAAFAALQAQYMQAAVTSTSPPPPPPPPPMLMMGGPPPPPPPPPPPMLMPTPPLILPTSSSRSKPVAAAQPAAALNMAQLLNEMKSVQLRPRRTDAGEPRPRTPERAAPAAVSAKSPQDALREALIRRFAQTRRAREASHEDEQSVHGVDDEWSATTGKGAQGEADDEDARKVAAARLGLKRAKEQAPPTVVEVAANIVPLAVLRRGESSSNLELDQAGNLRSTKGGELAPGKDGTFDPRQFLTKRGGGARKRSPGPVVKQDSAVEEQSDKEQRVVSGGGDGQDKKEVETV